MLGCYRLISIQSMVHNHFAFCTYWIAAAPCICHIIDSLETVSIIYTITSITQSYFPNALNRNKINSKIERKHHDNHIACTAVVKCHQQG